jgi:outer membrane protein OmpA-like peptidoglycan-associated protein
MTRRERMVGAVVVVALGLLGGLTGPRTAAALPIIECNGNTVNQPCDTDDTVCTVERCVQVGASSVECQLVGNAAAGTACESDGKVCTKDFCTAGVCGHEPLPVGTVCYDGQFCTDGETCDAAGNCGGGLPTCDDHDLCTEDTCDEAQNSCSHTPPMACPSDGNPCTEDACQPASGCSYPPEPPTTACDDGRFCSVDDHCDGAGGCTGALNCIDGNPCTDDSCDEDTDTCANQTAAGNQCDDGNACTGSDMCTAQGACVGAPLGDGTPCTAGGGCQVGGVCAMGACTGTAPVADGTPCSDEDACTSGEVCAGGACGTGAPVDCSDDIGCFLEGCDPAIGCVQEPAPGCSDAGPVADAGVPGADAGVPGPDGGLAFEGELAGGGCGCRAGARGGAGAGAVLLALAALALLVRRRAAALLLLLAGATGATGSARAQDVDAQIFQPATSSTGFVTVDGPGTLAPRTVNVGLTFDLAGDVLVWRDPMTGEALPGGDVVSRRAGAVLGVGVGLTSRLELGLAVPLVFAQDGDLALVRPGESLAGAALGDVRLSGKLHLLHEGGLDLAVRVGLGLPTGDGAAFAGSGTVQVVPGVVVGVRLGRATLALDVAYAARGEGGEGNLVLDDEIRAGAAVAVEVAPDRVWLIGEGTVRAGVQGRGREQERPGELIAGARIAAFGPWQVQVGGGAGLSHGYGAPAWRAFVALAWAPRPAPPAPVFVAPPPEPIAKVEPAPPPAPKETDQDEDGILDEDDDCPTIAEDLDGQHDEDGCPDLDEDADGIADVDDKCPDQAEVLNGVDDEDGCPDEGLFEVKEDRIVLEERVLFDTDRARVKRKGKKVLGAVVTLWNQHPEYDHIVIEGHADERGTDEYNHELALRRATHVKNALVEQGFPADKIEVVSYGRTRPRVAGSNEEAWEKNRRVEFVIVRKTRQPVPRGTP